MITNPEKTVDSLQTAVSIVRVSQARLQLDGPQELAKILASVLAELNFCIEDLKKKFHIEEDHNDNEKRFA